MHCFCLPRLNKARSVPQTGACWSKALCLTSASTSHRLPLPRADRNLRETSSPCSRKDGGAGTPRKAAPAHTGEVTLPALAALGPLSEAPSPAALCLPCERCRQPTGLKTGPHDGFPEASDIPPRSGGARGRGATAPAREPLRPARRLPPACGATRPPRVA